MMIQDKPNKIRAKLIVEVEAEFYDDESSEETLRYCVEQDLEKSDCNIIFVSKEKSDYDKLFRNVQTAASISDELIEQLRLFTEHQEIPNIEPRGVQKIVLIKS